MVSQIGAPEQASGLRFALFWQLVCFQVGVTPYLQRFAMPTAAAGAGPRKTTPRGTSGPAARPL